MFTDMVGSTALGQVDEAASLALTEEMRTRLRPLFRDHRGRVIKTMGDGFLIEFLSALEAVTCGLEIQRSILERNVSIRQGPRLLVRIGIHLGDVVEVDGDISGDAVNIASRIEPLAEPGGLCVTEQVYAQVRHKVSPPFQKLPPRPLKGVQDPIDVYGLVPTERPDEAPSGRPSPPRIAVLPLANISPDPSDEYFADGLTEELITVLSQIRGLRVIARTSVAQYKGSTRSIPQIGRELGVDSILEGSVRKAGDQLRITLQMIEVATEEHRWAHTYDRRLENIFAVQREIAERTAETLRIELLSAERDALVQRPTTSSAAYSLYLRGLHALRATASLDDAGAVSYFEAALREDPRFSPPYSVLANVLIGASGETRPSREVLPRARELVNRALELDPESSDAHCARGNLAMQDTHDWELAEQEFLRAIGLNPSSSTARFWFGVLLLTLQRTVEAETQLRLAIELDPLITAPKMVLVRVFMADGKFDRALDLLRAILRSSPERADLYSVWTGWCLFLDGRPEEARREADAWLPKQDRPGHPGPALLQAALGNPAPARAWLSALEGGSAPGFHTLSHAAAACAVLGETQKALDLLERDLREGERNLWFVYDFPSFDPLRAEPRFLAMLRSMNLPTTPGARRLWSRAVPRGGAPALTGDRPSSPGS